MVDLISRRWVKVDSRCQTCGMGGEDTNHVLFVYTVARQMWALSNVPWPKTWFHPESMFANFSYVLSIKKMLSIPIHIRRLIPWILWMI